MRRDDERGTIVDRSTTTEYWVFEEGFDYGEKYNTLREARHAKKAIRLKNVKSWIVMGRSECTWITTVQEVS